MADPTPEQRAEKIGQCLVHLVPGLSVAAAQIRDAEAAAFKRGLEEAAIICEQVDRDDTGAAGALWCAERIRARAKETPRG